MQKTAAAMSNEQENKKQSGSHDSSPTVPVFPSSITFRTGTDRRGRPCFVLSDGPQGDLEFTVIVNTLKHKARQVLDALGVSPDVKEKAMNMLFPIEWEGRRPKRFVGGASSDADLAEVAASVLAGLREK